MRTPLGAISGMMIQFLHPKMEAKPSVLYHGSAQLLSVLQPRPARGVGPAHDQLDAVYASHDLNYATAFGLPILPAPGGGYAWSMEMVNGLPQITIHAGTLDLSRQGYLYHLSPQGFQRIDDYQWACFEPVIPLNCTPIHPRDYLSWILAMPGTANP